MTKNDIFRLLSRYKKSFIAVAELERQSSSVLDSHQDR